MRTILILIACLLLPVALAAAAKDPKKDGGTTTEGVVARINSIDLVLEPDAATVEKAKKAGKVPEGPIFRLVPETVFKTPMWKEGDPPLNRSVLFKGVRVNVTWTEQEDKSAGTGKDHKVKKIKVASIVQVLPPKVEEPAKPKT